MKIIFYVIILFFVQTSCKEVYIRHSDIHHLKYVHELRVKNNKAVKITTKPIQGIPKIKTTETTLTYVLGTNLKTDTVKKECLIFLEDKKVIYFNKSYWVKKGAYDSTTFKYCNRDINF